MCWKELFKIISTLQFLAKQGSHLRGQTDGGGYFKQMLKLRCEGSDDLTMRLQRNCTWTSLDIQIEINEIIAQSVLRGIVQDMKANKYFPLSSTRLRTLASKNMRVYAHGRRKDFSSRGAVVDFSRGSHIFL